MRGKLRDKRATLRKETQKNVLQEKRSANKRDTRLQFLLDQQREEDENTDLDGENMTEETLVQSAPKQ